MRWARRLIAICALALAVWAVWWASGARGAQADTGWGLRATSQKAGPDDRQVLTLWAVQTPSGMHACVTANYGTGDSSNRPLAISCDWGR